MNITPIGINHSVERRFPLKATTKAMNRIMILIPLQPSNMFITVWPLLVIAIFGSLSTSAVPESYPMESKMDEDCSETHFVIPSALSPKLSTYNP